MLSKASDTDAMQQTSVCSPCIWAVISRQVSKSLSMTNIRFFTINNVPPCLLGAGAGGGLSVDREHHTGDGVGLVIA